MTCDIRYDSPMMTELATFPPLFWGLLVCCATVVVVNALAPRWLLVAWWLSVAIFVATAVVIVCVAALLRQYGCDIAYVTAWTNPFGRLPQTLAMSALAILVTGVALCVEKHGRELRP